MYDLTALEYLVYISTSLGLLLAVSMLATDLLSSTVLVPPSGERE